MFFVLLRVRCDYHFTASGKGMMTVDSFRLTAFLLFALPFVSCSSENSEQLKNDSAAHTPQSDVATTNDTTPASDVKAWLADRYGPESGIVEYEVFSAGQKTTQTWYFDRHGLREARYWRLDDGTSPLEHITIIDNGNLIVRGPGDAKPLRSTWHPDPNTALPNFRHLTPEMRRMFALKELPGKNVLEKKCNGYRLTIGETISDVWIWEGIMLYGEIQGAANKEIEPIVMRAVSLKTNLAIPEEKFQIRDGG